VKRRTQARSEPDGESSSESGSALVEMTWLGIVLLLPMVWIVLSVCDVQRGSFGVTAAARSAGRAFALAPDDATGRKQAKAAAAVALADQGLDDTAWTIEVGCSPLPQCHVGGAVVTVRIETGVALPFIPDFMGGAAKFRLAAEHQVPIGQYQEPGEVAP
jgi:Flp pilus assembly protein TadG